MGNFYLTTTLPYVNAMPHMGHALEFVQADIIARYRKEILDDDVFFNVGTDEHGLKIVRKAEEEGMEIQAFVDKNAETFRVMLERLGVAYTRFVRTTDPAHEKAAQAFWERCAKNGDIYKKTYQTNYCVGCELEKTDSELEDGRCPLHPTLTIERIDEENYFFRFSAYQQPLLNLYRKNPDFVLPSSRLREITRFVEAGLEDFSISRLAAKLPWGVPVPGDEAHVMYVWFDALVNYISTLGWPEHEDVFTAFWGTVEHPNAVQIAGKDNLRQQSAMWQAMLLSAGLPTSKQIIIHGFITSEGKKMSKTEGNVVDPMEILERYGAEALRYFLAREIPTFEDGDFTIERFEQAFQSGLANGIGNLVSRSLKMAASHNVAFQDDVTPAFHADELQKTYAQAMETFNIKLATDALWEAVAATNRFIDEKEPFKRIKTDPDTAKRDIASLLSSLGHIQRLLRPILPTTADKIVKALNGMPQGEIPLLFPRLEKTV